MTGASSVAVRTVDEVFSCLRQGKGIQCSQTLFAIGRLTAGAAARRTAGTLLNAASSRSHCVFTLTVARARAGQPARQAQVHFVDLAGSERAKQTQHEGVRLREASHING